MRLIILAAAAAAAMAMTTPLAAQAQGQMPSAADLIKMWDKNGDGVVDKAEWVAAGRPAERFDLVDANHDGKITVEELAAAMAKMRQQQGQ
ncbi:EF-hand domain-containing protein [Phenylobacterium sp.]|jgi:Ca2+-binding EF-hand superfamily protein|uniref:EF-hand domain-containing protein n=1 Tax=Phenylobacterium sp. TaxID=1871053 RepID=UPI0012180592|nr:EF-hand domain-containing protein [Phenylobacterium sp.]THD55763.1 MAG: EF-hand domain-containing protein [Phenylobacterium sp.]